MNIWELIKIRIDGVISDYPDILNELVIEYIIDYKLSIDYFKLLKKEILIYFIIILIIKVINLIELK